MSYLTISLGTHAFRDDAVLRKAIADRLEKGSEILWLARVNPTSQDGVLIIGNKENVEAAAVQVKFEAKGISVVGKPILFEWAFQRPRIVSVDLESDGRGEVVAVFTGGGAHALAKVGVLKTTKGGIHDLADKLGPQYGWSIQRNIKSNQWELHADSSTYMTGEVQFGPDGKPLTIVYTFIDGSFKKTKTVRRKK